MIAVVRKETTPRLIACEADNSLNRLLGRRRGLVGVFGGDSTLPFCPWIASRERRCDT